VGLKDKLKTRKRDNIFLKKLKNKNRKQGDGVGPFSKYDPLFLLSFLFFSSSFHFLVF
jgi:hypothetical protein